MNKKLRELLARKAALVASARTFNDAITAQNRDFTDEEQTQFDGMKAQIDAVAKSITAEEFLAQAEAASGIIVPTHFAEGARITSNIENDPRRGFIHAGEFLSTVITAGRRNGVVDERLLIGGFDAAAPTTFGSENIGGDGGYAVPPEFSSTIFTHSLGEDSLLPMTDNINIGGNSMVFPKDETTPWGTDGIRAYWQNEATVANQTKPSLSTSTLRLSKLLALVPLTDELLQDTSALNSYVPSKIADSIRWKTNEAIIFGLGNGTPAGFANSNAMVTVAKESGQATLTLQALNLANMIARLPAGSYPRSVWIINNDVLPALFTLTLGNYPIYMPATGATVGGIQVNPYGTLLGRPIMISQHAKSFSAQGDIMLADMSYYRTITKAQGIETATSMHLYFDADATAFRTTFRVDGGSKIVNPIAPANGSKNLSPFVQLGAR